RTRVKPIPATAASIAASAVLTESRECIDTTRSVREPEATKLHVAEDVKLSKVMQANFDRSAGTFGVPAFARKAGLAQTTRRTEATRVAIMLLSWRTPIRTARSTRSSIRWMFRSESTSRTSISG